MAVTSEDLQSMGNLVRHTMRVTISSPSALNLSLGRFKLEDEKQAVTILKPGICIQPEGWPQLPQRQIWVFLGLSIG